MDDNGHTTSPDVQTIEQEPQDNLTDFGSSLATLAITLFFIFCASYLGPYPDFEVKGYPVSPDSVLKWVLYILAGVAFIFFLGFWGVAMRNSPEMGNFFKAIWGGGQQGWQYASQTVFLVVVALLLHLLVALLMYLSKQVDWLGWLRIVAWIIELPVMILALFASVMFAYTCDSFFVKPVLETTATGGERLQTLVDIVRKRAVVVLPILIAVITLYVEVFR